MSLLKLAGAKTQLNAFRKSVSNLWNKTIEICGRNNTRNDNVLWLVTIDTRTARARERGCMGQFNKIIW